MDSYLRKAGTHSGGIIPIASPAHSIRAKRTLEDGPGGLEDGRSTLEETCAVQVPRAALTPLRTSSK
ncbi:hypothetical protein CFAM422_000086 [Trichoderma lentiforme]|uniref:Uncharacterized protein n=1 Tax=Trichoderma lentiforme TaxID=1567552 RepID=A0A9P4XQH7_9HYPO|nr:hypothetical protein CFAM422_000086 [Trichoderma lentiforme]